MCMFCWCMYVYHMHACCLGKLEEVVGFPGPRVTKGCESSYGCWVPNPGLLKEQWMFITIVPFLQHPWQLFSSICCSFSLHFICVCTCVYVNVCACIYMLIGAISQVLFTLWKGDSFYFYWYVCMWYVCVSVCVCAGVHEKGIYWSWSSRQLQTSQYGCWEQNTGNLSVSASSVMRLEACVTSFIGL